MKKTLSLLVLAALLATLLTGAALAEKTDLVIAVDADIDTLHPMDYSTTIELNVLNQLYDTLMYMNPDGTEEPEPRIAESYAISEDGLDYTFVIRDDVTFHNGQKLTANDVIATLDYMYELSGFDSNLDSPYDLADRGLYYSTFYSLKAWEAQDEHTLLFTLRRASYGSLYAFTFPRIFPKPVVRRALANAESLAQHRDGPVLVTTS